MMRKCSKCGHRKGINEFLLCRPRKNNSYRLTYCNDCRRKQNYLNLNNDVNKFLKDRYNRMKRRAGKSCDIKFEDFIGQYNKQEGKCFYSEEKMLCRCGKGTSPNSLSIDRVDNSEGYVDGNIVFCTRKMNTLKNNLTMKELQKYLPLLHDKILSFYGYIF